MPLQPYMVWTDPAAHRAPSHCRTKLCLLATTAGILQRLPQQASALFGLQKRCTGCCHALLLGCQRRVSQGCTSNIIAAQMVLTMLSCLSVIRITEQHSKRLKAAKAQMGISCIGCKVRTLLGHRPQRSRCDISLQRRRILPCWDIE